MSVHLSNRAASRVKVLLSDQDQSDLKLRVYINGGGCSGFQYGFTFDQKQNEDDFVLKKDEVIMLVDSMSIQFLDGAEVDFVDDLQGSRFVIHNPNVKTTCGCGASFSI